jgi:hypothetical protein
MVTMEDIDRSYTVLALLDMAALSARAIENGVVNHGRFVGSIAIALEHVSELAGRTHDALERAHRADRIQEQPNDALIIGEEILNIWGRLEQQRRARRAVDNGDNGEN